MCGAVLLWRSDDNLTELIISFYHMGPGDLTPVIGRDGRNLPAEPSRQPDSLYVPIMFYIGIYSYLKE